MATIDKLRARNNELTKRLNASTVVENDVKEIEKHFGLLDPDDELPKMEGVNYIKTYEVPKKPGRPKQRPDNEKYTQIHVSIPESLKVQAKMAAVCHKANMSEYILGLIKKDIVQNGEEYKKTFQELSKFS